jgi:hypothetical protein
MTATPIVHRGYHQEDFWALQWSSGWQHVTDSRASVGSFNVTSDRGATLSFDLDASWLDLVAPVGPSWGQLTVEIDGNPYRANRLPIQNKVAVLGLNAPRDQWQVRQPVADGLGPGIHHVLIRSQSGPVGIDAVVADRESPRALLFWQISGAIIGLIALVIPYRSRRRAVFAIVAPSTGSTPGSAPPIDASPVAAANAASAGR